MKPAREILVKHETPADGSAPFWRVLGGGLAVSRHSSIKSLAAWLDRHDYRYVWGTLGKWRLP